MTARTTLVVIDDHRVFAEALALRLGDQPDLAVVGTAQDAAGAWDLLRRRQVDVILLDLDLAGQDGLVLCRDLREAWPQLHVLVVTAASHDGRLLESVRAGAAGWVDKCSSMDLILNAIHAIVLGQASIPATRLARLVIPMPLADRRWAVGGAEALALTERELEVLRCLMAGDTRKEAAERLHLSPNTVRTHVQSILHKLNVGTTVKAVAVARRTGLASEGFGLDSPGRRSARAPDGRLQRGASSVTSLTSYRKPPEGRVQQWRAP